MTNRHNETTGAGEAGVDRLVALARSTFTDDLSAEERQGVDRLEESLACSGGGILSGRLLAGVAVGAAAVAAIALLIVHLVSPPALTFEVSGASLTEGGRVQATEAGEARIRFSDGSIVVASPRTRTRVVSLDSRGGTLALDQGSVQVRFVHRTVSRWSIVVGPYHIAVVGTSFDVSWAPGSAVLDVRVLHGTIQVKGPPSDATITMNAGQRLHASATRYELAADQPESRSVRAAAGPAPTGASGTIQPAGSGAGAPGETPAAIPVAGSPAVPAASAARRTGRATTGGGDSTWSWSARVARGDGRGVLDEAERVGIDRVLASGSRAELGALADAARYGGRPELARRALLAERERFPSTAQGHDAAFFLGGLAEATPGSTALRDARTWYRCYLGEQPGGSYAGEALGREMMLTAKLDGAAAARGLAGEVLARFPDGPYAPAARKLLGR